MTLIFLDQYVFILVGALGTLLQSNPNFSMTTDPSENPLAGNGIDAKITQIVEAQISGYYATRLRGNKPATPRHPHRLFFACFRNHIKYAKPAGALPVLCV